MSVVIVGGNERMERRYRDLCEEYGHTAKVFTKTSGGVRNVGSPDLLILFTNTMSHKMLRSVLSETKGQDVIVERCHTSSMAALKRIMDFHAEEGGVAGLSSK